MPAKPSKSSRAKVRDHRARLRAQGLRPIHLWVPDVRRPEFRKEAPLFRLPVEPSAANRLREPCRMMVDKITTMPKARLGERIGTLDRADITRLNRAALVSLGFSGRHSR